jgi:hypothetical protein
LNFEEDSNFITLFAMYKYIQDLIRNNSRSIFSDCTTPQKKALSEILRGFLTVGTPVLRHLVQSEKISAKKQAEKYSYHLGNVDLQKKVELHAVRRVKSEVKKNTIIAYDLTDINKDCAKKMEGLHRVHDGSQHKRVNGFLLHGVGVNGLLLKLELHDHDKFTLNTVRLHAIKSISEMFGRRGIWVVDRGNDGKQFFKDMSHKLKVQFIARLRENRNVVMKKTGAIMRLKDLPCGQHEIYFLNRNNNAVDTEHEFLLVIHQHLEEKKPIRLLCKLKDSFSSEQIVSMYLERWGIENTFKRAKQKFMLEKIRVLDKQKFVNLVALIQFAINICTITFFAIQKLTHSLISGALFYYQKFMKRRCLSINMDSFISFLQYSLKPLIHRPQKSPPKQLSLLPKRRLEKLGSF